MARKNRLVVEDGLYHITTRIAHQERLLADPKVKSLIVGWIYSIADFSGIEVYAWNVMDNHLHVYVHVPPVPKKYWLAASEATRAPMASAFSMRPAENRAPRWTPDITDRNHPITPAGDCPSEEALVRAIADGLPVAHVPHPPTGFTMSDVEMLGRLGFLYKPEAVKKIAERWAGARAAGRGDSVEREKAAYCRRMYNVSQYMKTLKQRISEHFNRRRGHEGQLWDGRFCSGLVDRDDPLSSLYVASYIELNSYRTKRRIAPKNWAWCSYATALGNGPYATRAREGYEKMFGVPWEEAIRRLESVFAAELPEGYDPDTGDLTYETGEVADGTPKRRALTMAQLVKVHCRMLERGGFISRSAEFAKKALAAFSERFPAPSERSVRFFQRFDWHLAA